MYQAKEFAELAGVTVRALHHYDRMAVLVPSARTRAGYRLYTDQDLVRVEQIVVLKFLGIPLKEIKRLLDRPAADLPSELRRQRLALTDRRRQLDRAIEAVAEAESRLMDGSAAGADLLKHIIEVIEMQDNQNWSEKYYSPEGRTLVEERKKLWNPELQEQVARQWAELGPDLNSAAERNLDPQSEEAAALLERYRVLIEGFTGGHPEVREGLNRMWADRENWPTPPKLPYHEKAEAWLRAATGRGE